ncbi:ATPase-like ATP-binding domain-containing protein [Fusarium pseudoanthophilum]|uniref:ATPase-like ATP-binding domain-containing protein n=1 Tax=Fusarium pseudoanthophilum TaxID=48495 RepID=A0A8H5KJ65_9HYPO|nr:ATPase-like ATP-binding domain-containing protein [Fusarium pseudoanthophilum]
MPDPQLLVPGVPSKVSYTALEYCKSHPEDFLPYLRRVWPQEGEALVEHSGSVGIISRLQALLENGETRRLCNAWIPRPELRRLRAQYLLPDEKVSFIRLDPPLPEDGTLGDWPFLPQLRCRNAPDVDFWIDTLRDIKFNSPTGEVRSPWRVKALYLLLYNLYLEAIDGHGGEIKIIDRISGSFLHHSLLLQPQGWNNPGHAVRYGPEGMYLKKPSMPLPAECMKSPLTVDTRERFKNQCYIAYIPTYRISSAPEWSHHANFVWSHGVKLPGKVDLSQQYPGLRSFFVDRLEIPELTMEDLQTQLLEVAAEAPANESLTLFLYLNTLVQNLDERIDPGEFISEPIFPVLTPEGELKRIRGDEEFFIVDDMRLFDLFKGQVNMLAFTRSQVSRLEPVFKWLTMGHKYLSRRVHHNVDWPPKNEPTEIEWDIGQKAEALLRIASHFRSPRTASTSTRKELLRALQEAKMMEVKGHVAEDRYPQLRLSTSFGRSEHTWDEATGRLVAHIPTDKKQQELALKVALPRLLMKWLMTLRRNHGGSGYIIDIPDLGVSLVKSILNAPPELANDILQAEGIEQPLIAQEEEFKTIPEQCLDKMEVQNAKAPLQTTRTPTPTTPTPEPVLEAPLVKTPVTEASETNQTRDLFEFVGLAPGTETVPGRKILKPHGPKRRSNAEASTFPGGSSPFTFETTIREKNKPMDD